MVVKIKGRIFRRRRCVRCGNIYTTDSTNGFICHICDRSAKAPERRKFIKKYLLKTKYL